MGDFPMPFGRYQLVERLAVGGMAELFVATHPGEHGFQKKVVIKRLLPHLVDDETYNAMFIDEAKLTARLMHPKIAQTFELGKVDDALFIAMEHVDGIDVLALLREFAARRRRVDPQLAAWIAHEVLDALDYAHNLPGEDGKPLGIVHRDISPSNVLLSVRGHIKLVDFGIARQKNPDRAHKSRSGTLKGKYGYMSPEQVVEQNLDSRSDLFSVGVVFAELLTGRRLFAAANELDVLLMVRDARLTRFEKYGGDIEAGLGEIVRRALKKNPDERWQTAGVFRDAIGEWLFQHRHRVTPRTVAVVVNELRDAVEERRHRQIGSGGSTAVVEEAAPLPSHGDIEPDTLTEDDDSIPTPIEAGGDSMPVIQLSYDDEPRPSPARTISASDLANKASERSPRSTTGSAQMLDKPSEASKRADTIRDRARPEPPAFIQARTRSRPHVTTHNDGSVDVPIADTISAAVEAITLPIEPSPPPPPPPLPPAASPAVQRSVLGVPQSAHGSSDVTPPLEHSEDSGLRSFDDLSSAPKDLSGLGQKSATPIMADITEPPDDSGDFAVTSPLRVLFRLMTARATGLLVVAVGGIKKEIYVRDGQPEYVSSNVASELFGNYLVTKNVLSDGELAMALAMMPHYGGKLGDTLVGLGLLKPLEVFRHLTRQVRSKIIDVCTWNKGGFGWYAGRENPREAFPLDFNAFEILGAGAMALTDEVIEQWIAKNGGLRLRSSRARRVGPERFEVKGLVELFEVLDGRRSVGDLVELQAERSERLNTGRMLALLEACDLARPS